MPWPGILQAFFLLIVLPGVAIMAMVGAFLAGAKAVSKSMPYLRRRELKRGSAILGIGITAIAIGFGIAVTLIFYCIMPLVKYS